MADRGGYDRHITIFSPQGRLYQIEYAFKAVKAGGVTSIAVKGTDTCAVVTQKKVQDKLVVKESVTRLFKITDKIGCVATGLIADCRLHVTKVRQLASQYKYDNGYECPLHYLAQLVADNAQLYTQHAGVRALASVLLLVAVDDEKGPLIFKVDPAGHFFAYTGVAAGSKEQEAINQLEKVYPKDGDDGKDKDDDEKKGPPTTEEETIRQAISTLQYTLSADFKPDELEVGYVTGVDGRFQRLSEEEIDAHLTYIAEED